MLVIVNPLLSHVS